MNCKRTLLFAALSLVGCGEIASNPVASDNEPLYGLGSLGQPWPGGNVPVCFTNINDQPTLQGLIPGILASSWTKAANIHFSGFGACNGGNVVAVHFTAGSRGYTDNLGYGGRSIELVSDDATVGRKHFTYEVIHEFGHALGFAHEMKRPDNWNGSTAFQCGVAPSNSDYAQYAPAPGGLYLTANYDPNSIMNYCDPNGALTTTLSVGDILAVSGPSAYGLSSCGFANASTACTVRPHLQYDSTYAVPASCPAAGGSWVLKQVGGGVIATAPEANTFALGRQAEGGAVSGPAIGSTHQYVMCDAFNNCSPPFSITITDCHTQLDSVYVTYNQTLYATQGSSGFETLEMVGPWMNYDYGVNATGAVVTTNLPNATFHFGQGYSNNTACYPNCFGFLDMTVQTSLATPPGNYTATVSVTDLATQITRTTVAPISVGACTPPPQSCAGYDCGTFTGCGQSLFCGSCSSGNTCSGGHCCPDGTSWDVNYGCTPPPCNCKPGYYCDISNTCVRVGHCRPGTCM